MTTLTVVSPTIERPRGLGASQIAWAIGQCRTWKPEYRKYPWELWEELTGRRPPFAGNRSTRVGQLLEAEVAAWYSEDFGTELMPGGTVQHTTTPWAFATPDRYLPDGTPVELKTTAFKLSADSLASYEIQCRWQMFCTGKGRCHLYVASLASKKGEVYRFERDPKAEASILYVAGEFWRHVEADERPPDNFPDNLR